MNGTIIQSTHILDPTTVPEYANQLRSWWSTYYSNKPGVTRDFGNVLYPRAISYLADLNVSNISNVRTLYTKKRILEGTFDLQSLIGNIDSINSITPEFDASIHPGVAVGTNEVVIGLNYSVFDNTKKFQKVVYEMGQQSLIEEENKPRSITISSKFDNPESARTGLINLRVIYPEAVFREALYAFEMPTQISQLQRAVDFRFSNNPGVENDDDNLEAFSQNKNLTHFLFLVPLLQNSGIMPLIVSWLDIDFKHQSEKIDSYSQLIEMVEQEPSMLIHLPRISASFEDRRVDLEFEGLKTSYGLPDYGVRILNRDVDGTLEDILENIQQTVF